MNKSRENIFPYMFCKYIQQIAVDQRERAVQRCCIGCRTPYQVTLWLLLLLWGGSDRGAGRDVVG